VVSLVAAVIWELRHPEPIINLRLLKERNFLFCGIVAFSVFGVLYGSTVLLPQMMQTLMGYSATMAGLVLSPAGFFTMLEMPLIGYLLSRRVDARWLIIAGLSTVAFAAFWMSTLNLEVQPLQIIVPRIVQTLGAGLLWVPINTAAYLFVAKDQTNNAAGLFNLIRNEGSSIGVSVATTLLQRHAQIHQVHLISRINILNPQATAMLEKMSAASQSVSGDAVSAGQTSLHMIYGMVQKQAQTLAYLDIFRLFAWSTLLVIPLVLLMRKSVAAKGPAAVH
jgi:DHA2 family multidrug resistance protein